MAVNKRQFALKKIHSLLGVIPLGLFLAEHFIVNASAMFGIDKFEAIVHVLESTPFIWVLEWTIIFIPLLIHGLLGVYFALQAKYNFKNYSYSSNIFFSVQRFSGLYLFVFLLYHIYSVKIHSYLTGETYASILQGQFSNPILFFLYFIFVVSASFHLMNGLYGFTINWGIARGERFQKIWQGITFIMFAGFSGFWLLVMLGFLGIIQL